MYTEDRLRLFKMPLINSPKTPWLVSGGDFRDENYESLMRKIEDKAYIYSWCQHSKDEIQTKESKIVFGISQFS